MSSPEFISGKPLSEFTTYKVGGPAEKLYIPRSREELRRIYTYLRQSGGSIFLLGGGSNLLIADRGLAGAVILLTQCCNGISQDELSVRAGAGIKLVDLVEFTVGQGIVGLENLNGIPGTLGGALTMNAGAYGAEISDHLSSIEFIDEKGGIRKLLPEPIEFSYRSAPGLQNRLIVAAEFEFKRIDFDYVKRQAKDILALRSSKQPWEFPSAGSVFKKHSAAPAGKLIEQTGLKGTRIGGAEVSLKHANFIINRSKARAIEILALMRIIQQTVKDKFGVELELEQRLVGFTEDELQNPQKYL